MVKAPLAEAYTCCFTEALQIRSTITFAGNGVPSEVAMVPLRNITRSPAIRLGCDSGSRPVIRVGFPEGEEGGGVGDGVGPGPGAGFCANAACAKSKATRAVSAKVRMHALILVCLGQSRVKTSDGMSLGFGKVQVNLNC